METHRIVVRQACTVRQSIAGAQWQERDYRLAILFALGSSKDGIDHINHPTVSA